MSGYLIWTKALNSLSTFPLHNHDIISSKRIEDMSSSKKSHETFHKIKRYLVNAVNDFSYLWVTAARGVDPVTSRYPSKLLLDGDDLCYTIDLVFGLMCSALLLF